MSNLIDGKAVAAKCRAEVYGEVKKLVSSGRRAPCLAVVLVGDDPASQIYVRSKKKACDEAGITSLEYLLPEYTSEEELLETIEFLNRDDGVDGILVQLPLPKHLHESLILSAIDIGKDVDCFHPHNVGLLYSGKPVFLPCTPAGVMRLLSEYGAEISGKECVIVGRSNIVGKPMAALLLAENGTVTLCHSKTADLRAHTKRADILVVACGKPKLIGADMIKPGAVIIDVGINRADGRLCGDVDFEACREKAGLITPVPGGVGPMTIAMLLQNTLRAAKNK